MRFSPLARQRPRAWALVTPGHRAVVFQTPDGEESEHGAKGVELLLAKYKSHRLFCRGSLAAFRDVSPLGEWHGDTWRGRLVRMHHRPSGASVISLRDALEGSDDPLSDLEVFFSWAWERGVAPGGFSGMATALWRSTLDRELVILSPDRVGRAALYGSRQQAIEPRRYKHQQAVDIARAYPHAMGAIPYGTRLHKVSKSTAIDPAVAGIALARVVVPWESRAAPLPVRVGPAAIQFQTGLLKGAWPFCELAAAIELGFDVTVLAVYAPIETVDLFGPRWQELVDDARSLPGAAGRLGKATTNTTWGVFGMRGDDRGVVIWPRDRDSPRHVKVAPRELPHLRTAHVAAETAARLRRRMLLEVLYGDVAPPIHVDTDGIILRQSSPLPEPSGDGPGEYRVKGTYRVVDVKAPQVWRGQCASCGIDHTPWHYCVAGVESARAPDVFKAMPKGTRAGVAGLDIVLPQGHRGHVDVTMEVDRARLAQVAVYGPGYG